MKYSGDNPLVYDKINNIIKYNGNDETLIIPASCTSIRENVFENCLSLIDVTILSSVSIGDSAFFGCLNLETVILPNELCEIGDFTFFSCLSLKRINIPNTVFTIGLSAFSYCTNLEKIVIPEKVHVIMNRAFEHCDKLTIYCEAYSKPEGWDVNWNPDNRPVVWGYRQD